MWAVEKYVGHWDGYDGSRRLGAGRKSAFEPNNYYLYSDPAGPLGVVTPSHRMTVRQLEAWGGRRPLAP